MDTKRIIVSDQTIREGMQYRGLMFSREERLRILEFQESLGVDISQAGYPPAHESELENVKYLFDESQNRGYEIRVSGLCRALIRDVAPMVDSGFKDYQLHTAVTQDMLNRQSIDSIFTSLIETVQFIKSKTENASIEVSLLDLGKTEFNLLEKCMKLLIDELKVDVLVLPDTSGIMAPNVFFDKMKSIVKLTRGKGARIGVHCHNDMGMASANTIMGVVAGARVIQTSALGIGERNGIADIFIVGKALKDQGYHLNLKTEDVEGFQKYYEYVNGLCVKKTGERLITYGTPFFGSAMKTHVAGTHGIGKFGTASDEQYFLNILCGKHLVKKYLVLNNIDYNTTNIADIVNEIKSKSVAVERSLSKKEVVEIVKEQSWQA